MEGLALVLVLIPPREEGIVGLEGGAIVTYLKGFDFRCQNGLRRCDVSLECLREGEGEITNVRESKRERERAKDLVEATA